jgi:hypothetical protein
MVWNYMLFGGCVAAAACGRLGYDATGGEGEEDTTGPPGPVSVRVVLPDGPVGTSPVFFNAPDGTLLGTDLTGPDGRVVYEIPPGAMVTVVHPYSYEERTRLETIANVQPGDELTFGAEYDDWASAGTITIEPPPAVTGAVEYVYEVGCRGVIAPDVSAQTVLEVGESCATEGGVTVLGHVHDIDSNDLAFTYAKNVVPGSGPITLPAWSMSMESYNLVIDDTPAGATTGLAGIGAVVNGVSYALWPNEMDFTMGQFTTGRDYMTGLTTELDYLIGLYYPAQAIGSPTSVMVSRSGIAPTLSRISASELLPGMTELEFKEGARPILRFALSDPALVTNPEADQGQARMTWLDAADNEYDWEFRFSPTSTEVQLPELPAFLANVVPPTSAAGYSTVEIGLREFDWVADYAAIRNEYSFGALENEYYYPSGEFKIRASLSDNPWKSDE